MRKSRVLIVFLAVLVISIGCIAVVGELLSSPAMRLVGEPPAELAAQSVTFKTNSHQTVSGWFSKGKQGVGVVLLLHGVRADRREMLGRAAMLHNKGYTVLLIDLPAHGQSEGDRITFGLREAEGVKSALSFIKQQLPDERIGVIGVSLGAASLVLAKDKPSVDAAVLEMMYPSINEAVEDRLVMRLGEFSRHVAPLLLLQLPIRLGITSEQLRPIDKLPLLKSPVLIAAGTQDQHTTIAEAKRIFNSAVEPKTFWAVDGAAHVDLHAYNTSAYEAHVLPFLAKYLRK